MDISNMRNVLKLSGKQPGAEGYTICKALGASAFSSNKQVETVGTKPSKTK